MLAAGLRFRAVLILVLTATVAVGMLTDPRSAAALPTHVGSARIAAAAGNERGIISQEVAKLALYAGATPDNPQQVERDTLDEIGAGAEGDWMRLGDLALAGDLERLSHELDVSAPDAEGGLR